MANKRIWTIADLKRLEFDCRLNYEWEKNQSFILFSIENLVNIEVLSLHLISCIKDATKTQYLQKIKRNKNKLCKLNVLKLYFYSTEGDSITRTVDVSTQIVEYFCHIAQNIVEFAFDCAYFDENFENLKCLSFYKPITGLNLNKLHFKSVTLHAANTLVNNMNVSGHQFHNLQHLSLEFSEELSEIIQRVGQLIVSATFPNIIQSLGMVSNYLRCLRGSAKHHVVECTRAPCLQQAVRDTTKTKLKT